MQSSWAASFIEEVFFSYYFQSFVAREDGWYEQQPRTVSVGLGRQTCLLFLDFVIAKSFLHSIGVKSLI